MINIVATVENRRFLKGYNPKKDDSSLAPELRAELVITYSVRGVNLQFILDNIGSYRLPIQSLTLREFMVTNGIERMTASIMKTLSRSKGILYEGSKENDQALKSLSLLEQKYPPRRFLGNLPVSGPDESFSHDKYLDAYLYMQTGTELFCERYISVNIEEEARKDLRETLLLVYNTLKKGNKIATFQDALDFVKTTKKSDDTDNTERVLSKIKAGYDIWEELSSEDIYRVIRDEDATKVASVYFDDIVSLKEQTC